MGKEGLVACSMEEGDQVTNVGIGLASRRLGNGVDCSFPILMFSW